MIHIALCGALGRMGGEVARAILEQDDLKVLVAVEAQGHRGIGTAVGETVVVSSLVDHIGEADVVVDFTNPEGAVRHLSVAADHGVPAVIGVTALNERQRADVEKASSRIPVVYAPNMSVGVNLLFKLVAETAAVLNEGYDVEIVEMHHRMKKDAPSGTAAKIADIVSTARGGCKHVYGRQGLVGERKGEEIGIHALRGGDVVGEHTVVFAGGGERLEITHKASSRRTFASGVIKAIRFVHQRTPGLYDMNDVLGLR